MRPQQPEGGVLAGPVTRLRAPPRRSRLPLLPWLPVLHVLGLPHRAPSHIKPRFCPLLTRAALSHLQETCQRSGGSECGLCWSTGHGPGLWMQTSCLKRPLWSKAMPPRGLLLSPLTGHPPPTMGKTLSAQGLSLGEAGGVNGSQDPDPTRRPSEAPSLDLMDGKATPQGQAPVACRTTSNSLWLPGDCKSLLCPGTAGSVPPSPTGGCLWELGDSLLLGRSLAWSESLLEDKAPSAPAGTDAGQRE